MDAIFLKKKYVLYTYPINVLVVLFAIAPRNGTPLENLKWLLIATVSHLAILPIFYLTFKPKSERLQTQLEILLLVCAGIVRGLVILAGTSIFSLPGTNPAFLRPLNSAITLPLWFFTMHYILDTRKLYHRKFQDRYVVFVNKLVEEVAQSTESTIDRDGIERELNETLEPLRLTLEAIAGRELSSKDLEEESKFIANYLDKRIRPLSHKMWDQTKIVPPKIRFVSLIKLSLFELKLPLAWLLIPAFGYQLVSATTIFGISQALIRSSISFFILTCIVIVYNFIFKKEYLPKYQINSLAILLSLLLPNVLIRTVFFPLVQPKSSFELEFVNFLWFATILMATSIAIGFSRYQERILAVFDLYLEDDSRSDRHAHLTYLHQQKFARYIHADIQSGLVASSIELNRAAESGDSELGKAAIERTAQLLRRDHRQYAVGEAVDPTVKLNEIIRAWTGIASFNVYGFETILSSAHTAILVCEILAELAANSVRHGQATSIQARIISQNETVSVTFTDDGILNTSKHKGLGTKILDEKTSSWTKDIFEDRNRVRFSVPV